MPTISFLNVQQGDKSVFFDDDVSEKRAELAENVLKLLHSGYALFLIHGQDAWRVRGYDAQLNEWILLSSPVRAPQSKSEDETASSATEGGQIESVSPQRSRRGRPRRSDRRQPRRSARGTEVSAIAPTAGG